MPPVITRRAFSTGIAAFAGAPAAAHSIVVASPVVISQRSGLLKTMVTLLSNDEWTPLPPDYPLDMASMINQALNGGPFIKPGTTLAWLAYAGAAGAIGHQTAAIGFFTQLMPQTWDYGINSLGVAGVANQLIGYSIQKTSKWESRALVSCTLQAIYDKGNAI